MMTATSVRRAALVAVLAAERGKTVLVYFGYTHCPDLCPATLADFARARRPLTARQRNAMRFVFVVDPEGRVRMVFAPATEADNLAADLRRIL